jgi:hypothetical protein
MLMKQSKASGTISYSILADRYITPLFVLMVFLGSFFLFTGSTFAANTSAKSPQLPLNGFCNNPYGGHCYAQITWGGHTGGSNTLINPFGALDCQGCNGFIDDEMWFVDPNSSQCTSTPSLACWVESGVSTWPASDKNNCNQGHDSTCLFWADSRPNPGSYHEHPLYNFGADGINLTPYLIYMRRGHKCSSRLKKSFEPDTEFQIVFKAVQESKLIDKDGS